MKKNIVRIVAAILVAMLALTLIPMGALALEPRDGVSVQKEYYDTNNPSMYDYNENFNFWGDMIDYAPGETIKVSDYNKLQTIDGKYYDFAGFDNFPAMDDFKNVPDPVTEYNKYVEWSKNTALPFYSKDITVPGPNSKLTDKEITDWYNSWGTLIFAAYTPHQHRLSYWYSDGTTHWKHCTVCRAQFVYQNWCQDGDGDEVCNVCGGHVPYHDVTVIETEGGKITVNKETAAHRTKITADVEAADGYKFEKLHFTKIRDDGSVEEITRYEKGGQFWTYMPTYDLEVTAEFTKK